ncbi:unnamed protein product [Mytilus coruscus]|uniref:DUF6589 domain-containing protein n=1 Tax=Mytilus coruscus TaxID=42192 RepID=A0A6J8EA13_MYTCO|nr:unnamed protein product [Mytilus coruscus]
MEHSDTCCVHCTHVFNVENLKEERRRSVGKQHKDVDLIKTLAFCYEVDEVKLRNAIGYDDTSFFVCSQCFNSLKATYVSLNKCRNLCEKLKTSTSTSFINLRTILSASREECDADEQIHVDTEPPLPSLTPALACSGSTARKRQRNIFTPSKSGCTPKAKRKASTKTPKKNRRRLQFTSTCKPQDEKPTPQVTQSPGPKVKVHLQFKGSSRKTDLKGPGKLACRSIVQKQYKTALNHLLTIEDAKKELVNTVMKNISQEVQALCKNKESTFRGSNISRFSWKSANKELERNCPLTLEILKIVAGSFKKKKETPRVVSSMAILLFNRNHQMNAVQSINSVFMFRGHVRTRVYSTFNRAGFSTSYKSTLSRIDQICESFDIPVKNWAKAVSEQHNQDTSSTDLSSSDHCYALTVERDNELVTPSTPFTCSEEPISTSAASDSDVHMDTTLQKTPGNYTLQDNTSPGDHCYSQTVERDNELVTPSTPFTCSEESPVNYIAEPISTSAASDSGVHIDTTLKKTPGNYILQDNTSPDMDSPFTTTADEAISENTSFEIVMDNLNCRQKTRHKTLETSNKTHNLVHSIAVQHRITDNTKDALHPQADILSIHNEAFIPNHEDYEALHSNFRTLIKRALVEFVPALKDSQDLVEFHIQHPYSELSAKKNNVIPLGILEKDENITEQMIQVVEHLQQYVPRTKDGKMMPILLGGDALSVERGEAASRARLDAITAEDRLDGFIWKSEDWHGHVISLQESYNLLYKGSSSGEKGTLFQLRNQFDRRGVNSEVKNAVNDCREFLRFVTKGHILLAAMQILGLTSLDDFETKVGKDDTEKKSFLDKLAIDIVTQFVATKEFKFDQLGKDQQENDDRIKCGYPGCPKTFAVDGRCRQKHRDNCQYKHFQHLSEGSPADNTSSCNSANSSSKKEDFKFNYACNVLREGLMDWNRDDASKENDGDRLVRMWRFDMLKFSMTNHTKYCQLAFKLQAQLMALLPPRLAFEMKHNRSVSIYGTQGGNVPGDQALEFMNMRAKDALDSLHGNMTSSSIQRIGRSLQGCNHILDCYSKGLDQYFGKPSNWKPSLKKDIDMFVNQLKDENLFDRNPGRYFRSFDNIEFETLGKLNGSKLYKWLTGKKEQYAIIQRTRSYIV